MRDIHFFKIILLNISLISVLFANKRIEYKITFDADNLFQQSTSQRLVYESGSIKLENSILVEDDGPACGYSAKESALVIIDSTTQIKKRLFLKNKPVNTAFIAMMVYPDFPPEPNNGRHLVFNVNGNRIIYEVNHFWTNVPVPSEFLNKGENEIVVRVYEKDTRFRTWVALAENYLIGSSDREHSESKSARSTDGGKTWDHTHLGLNGEAKGEYPIRLKLTDYYPEGWIKSPVIDLAKNSNNDILLNQVNIRSIRPDFIYELNGGVLEFYYRTGKSHVYNENQWTEWKQYSRGSIRSKDIEGRFFQFKVLFKDYSSMGTPVLKTVNILSKYKIADKIQDQITLINYQNKPLINHSFSFEYENPEHDSLKALRKEYNLDAVIEGADTEFERIVRLKSWVSSQWNWHLLSPALEFNEWNSLKILSKGPDGVTHGGYCLQYAIVLMQVLQSYSIPARIVNANYSIWGGHEMTEVWSNDFGKWVLMDPNFDTYFISADTGIPLNLLELHEHFLDLYYPNEIIDRNNWSRQDMVGRADKVGKPEHIIGIAGGHAKSGELVDYEWWLPTVELIEYGGGYGLLNAAYIRYLPRSNFFEEPYPIPINHGRTHWGWTGYYCWYDDQTPRSVEHDLFTNRPTDLYWNLNEVDFSAEIHDMNKVKLSLATNSPYFDYYELVINGTKITINNNSYVFCLNPGFNSVTVRVVDKMNNKGSLSSIQLQYLPVKE